MNLIFKVISMFIVIFLINLILNFVLSGIVHVYVDVGKNWWNSNENKFEYVWKYY